MGRPAKDEVPLIVCSVEELQRFFPWMSIPGMSAWFRGHNAAPRQRVGGRWQYHVGQVNQWLHDREEARNRDRNEDWKEKLGKAQAKWMEGKVNIQSGEWIPTAEAEESLGSMVTVFRNRVWAARSMYSDPAEIARYEQIVRDAMIAVDIDVESLSDTSDRPTNP